MKRKPIRVDWDALDDAFNSQNQDVASYLDLVTGQVALEGEGEDEYDDDEGGYEASAAPAPPQGHEDSTRLYVDPPDAEQKIEWMERFIDENEDLEAGLVDALRQALGDEEPAERLAEVLKQNPDLKDRWFRYRSDRVHELIEAWLEDHEVELVEPPPW